MAILGGCGAVLPLARAHRPERRRRILAVQGLGENDNEGRTGTAGFLATSRRLALSLARAHLCGCADRSFAWCSDRVPPNPVQRFARPAPTSRACCSMSRPLLRNFYSSLGTWRRERPGWQPGSLTTPLARRLCRRSGDCPPVGVKPISAIVHSDDEIAPAIDVLAREPNAGVIAPSENSTLGHRNLNLPVQAPTKFQLGINLRAARSPGRNVSPTMLVAADEVIE